MKKATTEIMLKVEATYIFYAIKPLDFQEIKLAVKDAFRKTEK